MREIDSEELVILARLDATNGFFSFADALSIAGQLQVKGISAHCERAPGALMDSPDAFYLKVPVSQVEGATTCLQEILSQ